MAGTDQLPGDEAVPVAVPLSEKLLVRSVYIMGIMLVVMFLILIGGIIYKIVSKPAKVEFAPAAIDLGLAPGEAVQSVALDGDRLAITTGGEIIIIDIRKNIVVSRIATKAR